MEKEFKKIFSAILCGVMCFIFLLCMLTFIAQKAAASGNSSVSADNADTLPLIDRMITGHDAFVSSITDMLTDSNPLYYTALLATKSFDKAAGLNLTTSICAVNDPLELSDIVVDLGDGCLDRVVDQEALLTYGIENIESLVDFGLSVEENGRNFLAVLAPSKIEFADYDGLQSEVFPDYSAKTTALAVESLTQADLNSLSLKEAMEENGLNASNAYYKTDHHWTARTGLFACGVLCEHLNILYGYQTDPTIYGIENYTITTLEDHWLGSLGRKSTTVYSDLDDFEIILPDYNTDLEVCRSNTDTTYSGSMEETLLNLDSITESPNLYEYNAYAMYGYGDMACISVKNNDLHDGSNLLLIRNSYADCMVPYLAASFEYLYTLDLRYYTGSVEDFIEETDPDTVVVLYNTSSFAILSETDHTGMFDFR